MATSFKEFTHKKLKISISLILVVLLLLPPLADYFVNLTQAASLTNAQVQIGDSRAGASTYHRFQFVTPSTTNIKTIVFQYCTTASGTCTAPAGMVLTATPTLAGVAGIGGTSYSAAGTNSNCTGTSNTNCTITLTVGTPAAQTSGSTVIVPVTTGITNPTTINTTYFVRITTQDSGSATIDGPTSVAFGILDTSSIAVTATVDPNFTFTVAGVSSGGNFNGGTGNINVTTTANSIPFGTLVAGTPKIAAHDVTITTNAANGYLVTASNSATISGNPPLVSGTNSITTFTGTNASPTTWSSPNGTVANTNTGFFGYSTEDATTCTGTANRFTTGGAKWAGPSTTGAEVICSTSGVSAKTTRVGWQLQVNAVQPAGSYSGTAILVATPTY